MTISIKNSNPNLVNRFRNYFYNKGVQCMLCNDDTEVSLFSTAPKPSSYWPLSPSTST